MTTAKFAAWREKIGHPEHKRVVGLPVMDYRTQAQAEYDSFNERLRTSEGEQKLWLDQVAGLIALRERQLDGLIEGVNGTVRGGFIELKVGAGKTLIGALAPTVWGCSKPWWLVPASLRAKTLADLEEISRHWKIAAAHVFSYHEVSNHPELLDEGDFDCLICDEADALKNMKSARTNRFLDKIRERGVPVCLMTATRGEKLEDFAHLADAVLRQGTPIPMDVFIRKAWAAVLNIKISDWDAAPGLSDFKYLKALFDIQEPGREAAIQAFGLRWNTTPGVFAGGTDGGCDAKLQLAIVDEFKLSKECLDAIKLVTEERERPDGEPLPDPKEVTRVLRQLSHGFYYIWDWEAHTGNPDPDIEYQDAKSQWFAAVRSELDAHMRVGYDTVGCVEDAVRSGSARTPRLAQLYQKWQRERERLGGDPPVKTLWVDRTVPGRVVHLAKSIGEPVIVWCESLAMQAALAEDGITVFGAGTEPPRKPSEQVVAMSWRAHGKGRNLQAWRNAIIIEMPGKPTLWEQLLGRVHRQGQKADLVSFAVLCHTEALRKKLLEAVDGARKIQVRDGLSQKLCTCEFVGWRTT